MLNRITNGLLIILLAISSARASSKDTTIYFDATDHSIRFAVNDLCSVLKAQEIPFAKNSVLTKINLTQPNVVILAVQNDEISQQLAVAGGQKINKLKKEEFAIRVTKTGDNQAYWVIGGDRIGTMYGGLDLAEKIKLQIPIQNCDHSPYIEKRGLKFNIPLDARTPSYADFGESAQMNIETMWDMDYWKQFIDDLARYRYNTISLWNCHPFPSIIKLDDYPDVALNDVMQTTLPLDKLHAMYETNGREGVTPEILANLKVVKTISMDEKILFWQQVMQYAHDRGIEFYWFTWNIFVWGADGKYGITSAMDNGITKEYYRKCISKTFETYPLLAGIGLTAGENMPGGAAQKEKWLYDVYAQGMNDASALLPKDRQVRIIHRGHQVNVPSIVGQFKEFNGMLDFSFKYSGAHIYANTDPDYVYVDFVNLPSDKRAWVELRDDDIFYFRWGDPQFAREFITNLPGPEKLRGYVMGPDGYVWGREFSSTNPNKPRELEISKHWYRFMMWGRLGYDKNLTDTYFRSVLNYQYPQLSPDLLFNAWTAASKIYPRITEFYWFRRDLEWAVEACLSRKGWGNKGDFHTVKDFAYGPDPQGGNGDFIKIDTYVKNIEAGKPINGTTPLMLADELRQHSKTALKFLDQIPATEDKTIQQTLNDIRAMALLGFYYADKLNGATELRFFDANQKQEHRDAAVKYMRSAAEHWKNMAKIASAQYKPQYLARNSYIDWNALSPRVMEDIAIAQGTLENNEYGVSPRTNNLGR